MRWSGGRFKSALGILGLLCLFGYLFLLIRMTFVPMESTQLEPDVQPGDLLIIHDGEESIPGELVAFDTDDGLVVQRVFLEGPARVKCIAGNAVVDGRLVEYQRTSQGDLRLASAITIRERWGSIQVPIIKRQQLLPYPLPTNQPELLVEKGQLLTGCQNRISCSGCGFHRVAKSNIRGRVGSAGTLLQWGWFQ